MLMLCHDCPHRQHKSTGCFAAYSCRYTGAQVGPFVMGANGETKGHSIVAGLDDPDCCCPLTLTRIWRRAPDQALGVMRGVDQRGLLEDLLGRYPAGERLLLATFYRERMEAEAAKKHRGLAAAWR